ncbi:MAG: hypothetical protein KF694_17885 [Mesorhizobium sp.]|nr:hypothetical protein [Mesorhizobium sp.]
MAAVAAIEQKQVAAGGDRAFDVEFRHEAVEMRVERRKIDRPSSAGHPSLTVHDQDRAAPPQRSGSGTERHKRAVWEACVGLEPDERLDIGFQAFAAGFLRRQDAREQPDPASRGLAVDVERGEFQRIVGDDIEMGSDPDQTTGGADETGCSGRGHEGEVAQTRRLDAGSHAHRRQSPSSLNSR